MDRFHAADTLATDSRFTLLPNHGLLNSDDLIERIENKCLQYWKSIPSWLGLDFTHRQHSGLYKTRHLKDYVKEVNQLPPELFYGMFPRLNDAYKNEINKYYDFKGLESKPGIKKMYENYKKAIYGN